jgi:hypothetical protein
MFAKASIEELNAYRQKLITDFMLAIMNLSHPKGTTVMHIHTGEVMHAALFVMAMCSSSDPALTTPAKRKLFARDLAKKFLGHYASAKKMGGMNAILHSPILILDDEDTQP